MFVSLSILLLTGEFLIIRSATRYGTLTEWTTTLRGWFGSVRCFFAIAPWADRPCPTSLLNSANGCRWIRSVESLFGGGGRPQVSHYRLYGTHKHREEETVRDWDPVTCCSGHSCFHGVAAPPLPPPPAPLPPPHQHIRDRPQRLD